MRPQVYELSSMHFLPKDWIMERWEEGFYITAMAGSAGGSSLVVMSKGTPYTQQSYKVRRARVQARPCQGVPLWKRLACQAPSTLQRQAFYEGREALQGWPMTREGMG